MVDELEEGTTQEDLENLLLKYGEVKEIKNFDKKNGDESSKILVIMTSPLGTRRIMDDVKNLTINAKKVLVKLASQQPGIKPVKPIKLVYSLFSKMKFHTERRNDETKPSSRKDG